jgi:hypothetical protein
MRSVSIPGGESADAGAPPAIALPPDGPDPYPPSLGDVMVYDIEIKNAIPSKKEPAIEGIRYCEGWTDYAGMGIAIVTAYDFATARYRVFTEDNLWQFARLVDHRDFVVGFNSKAFDENILATYNIHVAPEKSVDLLHTICIAAGLEPRFPYTNGYGLDPVYLAISPEGVGKTGNGALAPIAWQQGRIGEVIDYGLNDTQMTTEILMIACATGLLKCPKTGNTLSVREHLPPELVQFVCP